MTRNSYLVTKNINDLQPGDCVRVRLVTHTEPARVFRSVLYRRGDHIFDQEGHVIVMKDRLAAGIGIEDHLPFDHRNSTNRIWLELDPNCPRHSFVSVGELGDNGVELQRKGTEIELALIQQFVPRGRKMLTADEADQLGLALINQAAIIRNGR